jgi:hypothetical protein
VPLALVGSQHPFPGRETVSHIFLLWAGVAHHLRPLADLPGSSQTDLVGTMLRIMEGFRGRHQGKVQATYLVSGESGGRREVLLVDWPRLGGQYPDHPASDRPYASDPCGLIAVITSPLHHGHHTGLFVMMADIWGLLRQRRRRPASSACTGATSTACRPPGPCGTRQGR